MENGDDKFGQPVITKVSADRHAPMGFPSGGKKFENYYYLGSVNIPK